MRSLLGLALGLTVSLLLALSVGENPWHVFKVLLGASFSSGDDFAMMLYYSTSLMFTGLAAALSFKAGLFNIGAEGQLLSGSLMGTMAALLVGPMDHPFPAFLTALFFSLLGGALCALIPALLKAYRGSHEVIVTMMMNFIAAGLVSYAVVGPLKNPETQSPETALLGGAFQFTSWDPLRPLFEHSPLNVSFFLALILCLVLWIFDQRSRWGFEWKVMGANPSAAPFNAISPKFYILLTLTLSGAIAGLVAMNDIFGSAGKLRLGFSPDYGFVGIAVALLARNHPLGVIPSAILFGALQKGAMDLDLETERINRDFAKIIQAIIILSVIAVASWPRLLQKFRRADD